MQREHTSTPAANARPVEQPSINEETASSTIDVCVSMLTVAATALNNNPDKNVVSAAASTVFETVDRLEVLRDQFSRLCEADYPLLTLISRYKDAAALYLPAVDAELPCGPEERQFNRAIDSLLSYRCHTTGGVRVKAGLFLEDESLFDVVCNSVDGAALKAFLASLAEGGAA